MVRRRKSVRKTYYKYRNSALSEAGMHLCRVIQREWANVEVQLKQVLTMMTVFMIAQSENLPLLEDREAELLELCFLAELLNKWLGQTAGRWR